MPKMSIPTARAETMIVSEHQFDDRRADTPQEIVRVDARSAVATGPQLSGDVRSLQSPLFL